jgi:two-component system invasion response regulator UvrY
MYDILIVDDHAIVSFGLQMLLKDTDFTSKIEKAGNGDEAIEMVKNKKFDLVIMDINMPNTDSLSLLSLMLTIRPDIRVLVFSMNPEEIFAKRYLKLGASGYLSKDAPNDEVVRAIVQVLVHHKNYFSEDMLQLLYYDRLHNKKENPFNSLSEREFEVTMHLLKGESLSELSHILKLHTSTVGTHKARLFEKLEVTNIIELSKLAKNYNISL